jgi:hypothetical protein
VCFTAQPALSTDHDSLIFLFLRGQISYRNSCISGSEVFHTKDTSYSLLWLVGVLSTLCLSHFVGMNFFN